MKTSRTLTIEDFNPAGRLTAGSNASQIRLKGRWLKHAGFHAGIFVTVSIPSPGVIELRTTVPAKRDDFDSSSDSAREGTK
jgi:hypothetical protein